MQSYFILSLIFLLFSNNPEKTNFKDSQLKFSRVTKTYKRKNDYLKSLLKEKAINGPYEIFIPVFKREALIEIWIKNRKNEKLIHLKNYTVCRSSGTLGPKRKSGDLQVLKVFILLIGLTL